MHSRHFNRFLSEGELVFGAEMWGCWDMGLFMDYHWTLNSKGTPLEQ